MAMQVNLLPDSKQQRLKAKRIRRLILGGIVLVLITTVASPLVLLATTGTQNLLLGRAQKNIDNRLEEIRGTENIVTILSVQDRLNALPPLYQQRLIITELLNELPAITPKEVRLETMSINTLAGGMVFTGSAPNYFTVRKFYHALQRKPLTIDPNRVEPDPDKEPYFTSVLLQNVSTEGAKEGILFEITAQFAPELIDGEKGEADGQTSGQ